MADPYSDAKDIDPNMGDHEDVFFKYKARVVGLRRDREAQLLSLIPDTTGVSTESSRTSNNLPKLSITLPPILKEDTDLREFRRWTSVWENYFMLAELERRPRATQIATFWQCCAPGFLKIINHTIGIKNDTGRTIAEVFDLLTLHLRSLRNPHVDMKDLLAIRQKDGQNYTSLCNEIRELGDYADARNLTEDTLYIGLLMLAMRNDSDKAKLMTENPKTVEEARKFILTLETSKKGQGKWEFPLLFRARGR